MDAEEFQKLRGAFDAARDVHYVMFMKPCGFKAVRRFADVLTLQQVWDALRAEWPAEDDWRIYNGSEALRALPQQARILRMPWGEALRLSGARPVLPEPNPVVYALMALSHA